MPVIGKKKKHRNVADSGRDKELIFKDDTGQQMYACVQKALGSSRFMVKCDDGTERIGKLRGNMRRSEWVSAGTLVLVAIRSEEESKVDILLKYSDNQMRSLKRYGELHAFDDKGKDAREDEEEDYIEFEADDLIDTI